MKLIPVQELKTVINKEMSEATIKDIFETIDTIKLEKGIEQVDVIIGGPPCQAYSLVGRAQSSHMLIPMEDDPRNVLLHTLSHMLIKEMAMQSGYSSSALHERIYSSENMCGLLIYTGAADKEGSLGGLVELGGMNKLLPLLKGALENGLTCTTDLECFMKNPTSDRLNGAACHSCTMISETACENGKRLLDRALVVHVPEHEEMGYFRGLVRDLCGIQV